jgi:nucleoid-associated protein YgaU
MFLSRGIVRMRSFRKNCFPLLVVIITVFVMGCGDPVPLKEMAAAKYDISQASTVKAEKYAPALLKEATALLIKSHDNVKEEKYDDAAKNANAADAKAKEAYDVSVPLLAKDALDAADKAVLDADEVYASELANADYDNAVAKQKSAHELFESRKYLDSYKTALEAERYALNARDLALNKKNTLKDAIAEVNETISRAEKIGAKETAPEKLKVARDSVAAAQTSYDSQKLKAGFAAIGVAKGNADEAYLAALKASAAANIVKADAAIADAEKNPSISVAANELDGAKEMQKTARSQYDNGQYNESIQSSNEAVRLAAIALSAAIKAQGQQTAVAGNKQPVDQTVTPENTEYQIYVVRYFKEKLKDCLWLISGNYYKDPRKWRRIYNANKDVIKNPDLIRPGWKLKIPTVQETEAPKKEVKGKSAKKPVVAKDVEKKEPVERKEPAIEPAPIK